MRAFFLLLSTSVMKINFEDKKLSTMAPRPIHGLYQQIVDNF